MGNLSLVKSLSHLREEQKYIDELVLETWGVAFLRGGLAEITGEASTGKTSLPLNLLSKLTKTGEICAVVDSVNSFDPPSASLAGVELENLLWVRCGGDIEKAFMSADMLVQAKGFGAVWFNLNGLSQKQLRMVPKTYWYRYRNRIKETPTIFLVTGSEPVTGSASQRSFSFTRDRAVWSGGGRYKLLREFHLKCASRKGGGLAKSLSQKQLMANGNNYELSGSSQEQSRNFYRLSRDAAPHPYSSWPDTESSETPKKQLGTVRPFPRPVFDDGLTIRIEFDYREVK